MTVAELMAGYTPSASYEGAITADDYVLAIATKNVTNVSNYLVVQAYVEGVNSSINSQTSTKRYIRAGESTIKISNQRQFSVTGDRYVGDAAQDLLMQIKYATGDDAILNYAYFEIKTGKGEKGQITVSVDTDAGGNAGDPSNFSITLSKVGAAPEPFVWGNSANTYYVNLDANGGTIAAGYDITSYTYSATDAVTLPTSSYVTKTGYTFDAWVDLDTVEEATTIPAGSRGNKAYKAKWTSNA